MSPLVYRWQPPQSSPNSPPYVNSSDSPTKINSIAANFDVNRQLTLRPKGPVKKFEPPSNCMFFLDINEINKHKIWSRKQNWF